LVDLYELYDDARLTNFKIVQFSINNQQDATW